MAIRLSTWTIEHDGHVYIVRKVVIRDEGDYRKTYLPRASRKLPSGKLKVINVELGIVLGLKTGTADDIIYKTQTI